MTIIVFQMKWPYFGLDLNRIERKYCNNKCIPNEMTPFRSVNGKINNNCVPNEMSPFRFGFGQKRTDML